MKVLLSAILCLAACAGAEDITLTDGTVLRQAKILRKEAATLKIEHKDGISNVGPGMVPYEVSRRYTWDSKALESAKQAAAAVKAAGDAQEASRRQAATADKAREDKIDALLAERNAERKAAGIQAGPLMVWLQISFPTMVQRSGLRSGHLYGICIENTGDKTFRGIARGSVYLDSIGDTPLASKLVIEPGKTGKFVVDSQIGCSDETFIALEIEAPNQKVIHLKLPAPKSLSIVEAP
jgi:hypothetical protein